MNFRIVGRHLPGLKFGRSAGAFVHREHVHLGIQRRGEVIDLIPGDASRAVFDFQVDVTLGSKGCLDFLGPFVHGERGKRLLYLNWGEVDASGGFSMFRRAKLPLTAIAAKDLIGSPSPSSLVVEATLDLTDEKGGPICGKVAASALDWQVLT